MENGVCFHPTVKQDVSALSYYGGLARANGEFAGIT